MVANRAKHHIKEKKTMKTEIKLFCGTQNFTLLIHINLNVAATIKEFEDAHSENLVKPYFS